MKCSIHCPLCIALERKDELVENTHLFETEFFTIIPCVGPLVRGQVMIVTKSHEYKSFAELPDEHIREYELLTKSIRKIYNNDVAFAEHGSYLSQTAGKCISHAHSHVIPGKVNFLGYLSYLKFESLESMKQLTSRYKWTPYILIHTKKLYVAKAYNIQSQFIRIIIANEMKVLNRWNWRTYHDEGLLLETIKEWKEVVPKISIPSPILTT